MTYVKLSNNNGTRLKKITKLMLLNARLIKNKDNIITDELENNKIEIVVLTETWIK